MAAALDQLINNIRTYGPIVAKYLDVETPLAKHAAALQEVQVLPEHLERQKPIKEATKDLLATLFGQTFVNGFRIDWEKPLVTNIVDHHGILTHPLFASAGLLINADQHAPVTRDYLVFSSANIPANNFFYKKGVELHGKRAYLFSNAERHRSHYLFPPRDFDVVERTKAADAWKTFTAKEQAFLTEIQAQILALPGVKDAASYHDQIAHVDRYLWKRHYAPEAQDRAPELAMASQEELMRRLIQGVLANPEHIITRTLNDSAFQKAVLEAFDGINGCWHSTKKKGTHFFFVVDDKGEMKDVRLEGHRFVPTDPRLQDRAFENTPEVLMRLIDERKILPSLFTIFGVLIFWTGIKPIVGFGSMTYLTKMREAWAKALRAIHDETEAKRVENVVTNGFGAGILVTYRKQKDGQITPLSAFDILYEGGLSNEELDRIGSIPFNTSLVPALPDIEQYYVPEAERVSKDVSMQSVLQEAFGWAPEARDV